MCDAGGYGTLLAFGCVRGARACVCTCANNLQDASGAQCKYENGSLTKHKVQLVARGFTQVSSVDYRKAHFYAPVVHLELPWNSTKCICSYKHTGAIYDSGYCAPLSDCKAVSCAID